ncbi:DUF5362 family protein [uncultured Lacticaseibacillus sp.]|jgi:uncharacterized membrane protein|uniref:DUF5362 family protein n=1 Tax=uncultured Lacticaseibacillus sp. TaxID=2775882 RepID=UPI002598B6B3|nr:DUF5362 family protein [uncultured Lacticaseibacillus sp.]
MRNPSLQTAKTLSYVGAIWSIVVGALLTLSLIGAVVGVPIIIGGALLLKFRNATDEQFIEQRNTMLGWGIFFLIFTVVGGVLELVAYVMAGSADTEEFRAEHQKAQSADDFDDLERAAEMKEKGVLSETEYESLKERILRRHE